MIEIKDLNYYIKNKPILQNINLQIQDGEFCSIIGPNGAGKSTLIKTIVGLINDHSGIIKIDGVKNTSWLKDNIFGYLPQRENFDRDFPISVTDIVFMGLSYKKGFLKYKTKSDKIKIEEALSLVGALEYKNKYIGNLSGGEFQRIMLARALVTGSKYIILDEPESGVDKNGVISFYSQLQNIQSTGKTIVMVSHDVTNTVKFCSSIVCLNKTLHCHHKPELINAKIIKKTYGDTIQIIERK